MTAQTNYIFADNVNSAFIPENPYFNNKCDVMDIEVSGTFTSGQFIVEGKTNLNSENYTPLAAINLSNFTVATNGSISKAGIYEVGIAGIQIIRVRVVSVSGGNVTILGRAVNSAV